ncbi:MAG: hypothetical protein ACLTH3_00490 [Lachnospira sp.]
MCSAISVLVINTINSIETVYGRASCDVLRQDEDEMELLSSRCAMSVKNPKDLQVLLTVTGDLGVSWCG